VPTGAPEPLPTGAGALLPAGAGAALLPAPGAGPDDGALRPAGDPFAAPDTGWSEYDTVPSGATER